MLELISRGYQIGGGMISPNKDFFWLSIPKNASTFMTNVLQQNQWEFDSISFYKNKDVICILRDPVERWISGFTTYCCLNLLSEHYGSARFLTDYNELFERLVFDNIVFDDHTTPQVDFVNLIPKTKNIIYLYANSDTLFSQFENTVNQKLEYDIHHTDNNSKENNYDANQISQWIKSRLTPELEQKIKMQYNQDYHLIDLCPKII